MQRLRGRKPLQLDILAASKLLAGWLRDPGGAIGRMCVCVSESTQELLAGVYNRALDNEGPGKGNRRQGHCCWNQL